MELLHRIYNWLHGDSGVSPVANLEKLQNELAEIPPGAPQEASAYCKVEAEAAKLTGRKTDFNSCLRIFRELKQVIQKDIEREDKLNLPKPTDEIIKPENNIQQKDQSPPVQPKPFNTTPRPNLPIKKDPKEGPRRLA